MSRLVRMMENENNTIFQWSDDYGNWTGALTFPVTLSEDHNTITIHALEYAGVKYYPNVIGISEGFFGITTYILENPIVSDVVLTRGWSEDGSPYILNKVQGGGPATKTVGAASKSVSPVRETEFVKYVEMSDFSKVKEPVVMKGEVVTYEKLQKNLESYADKLRRN